MSLLDEIEDAATTGEKWDRAVEYLMDELGMTKLGAEETLEDICEFLGVDVDGL